MQFGTGLLSKLVFGKKSSIYIKYATRKNEAYLQEEIAGKYAFYVGTLFGYFYQECLLAEDRFKKEDLVKNAFFFAKVLN